MSKPHPRYERAISMSPDENGDVLPVEPDEEQGVLGGDELLDRMVDTENISYFEARQKLEGQLEDDHATETEPGPIVVAIADRALALTEIMEYYGYTNEVNGMKQQLARRGSRFWRDYGSRAPRVYADAVKKRAEMLDNFHRGVHTLTATKAMLANGIIDEADADLARITMQHDLNGTFSGTGKEIAERRQQLAKQVGDAALEILLSDKKEQP